VPRFRLGLDAWLRRRPRATVVAIGLGLVAALGYVDAALAPDLAPLAYLAPIALVAWFGGRWAGALVALAGTGAWLLTEGVGRGFWHEPVTTWDVLVQLGVFLVLGVMVAALRESLDRERQLARTDTLTGVGNARAFYEAAAAEIARARRYQHPFTAVYVDLDNFRVINDRLGHTVGDAVLRSVARAISGALRRSDIVARMGGEEFCMLLPETATAPARVVIAKLREALSEVVVAHGWRVSTSIGVMTYLVPPESVDDLVRGVDQLMHAAKQGGENAVEHATAN
jgi:diguanylate cyclase (GGDEF)-like protein